MQVEIQDADGRPVPGFTPADCRPITADAIDHRVRWTGGTDLSTAVQGPIRLRFRIQNADLYAMQFVQSP